MGVKSDIDDTMVTSKSDPLTNIHTEIKIREDDDCEGGNNVRSKSEGKILPPSPYDPTNLINKKVHDLKTAYADEDLKTEKTKKKATKKITKEVQVKENSQLMNEKYA